MERLHVPTAIKFTKDKLLKASSKVVITPENLPLLAHPIADFIHQEKPDYVMAFDRGARLLGVATLMIHRRLYGELPTRDRKINLRKVSTSVPQEEMRRQLQSDVEIMLEHADTPQVLLLDDLVNSGKTRRMATDLITEFSDGKVDILFGVLRGKGKDADVSGDRHSFAYCAWRNRSDVLGVNYDHTLQPTAIRSPKAVAYRRRLVKSVNNYIAGIEQSGLPPTPQAEIEIYSKT